MKNKLKYPIQLKIFELIWIYFATLSLISVFTLTFDLFKPLLVIIVSACLTLSLFLFKIVKLELKDSRFDWIILFILALSLFIRLNPWIYLEGGQDQGVYVSMSAEFERNGRLKYEDNVYSILNQPLKELYTQTEGWKALGFNRDESTNEIYSNFYPAHPALMSVFGYAIGDDNRVYTLTLFSILSIASIYLLATSLTKNRKIGYVAAILLSISPLHLYFSKFPTTEMMTLALNLSALYFIYTSYRKKDTSLLWLSLLLINVTFYTRLTWIVSIPFYILMIFAVLAYEKDRERYRAWGYWGIAILVSFLISTVFYFFKINFLYTHFYADIFKYVPENIFYILLFSSPFIIYLLTTRFKKESQRFLKFIYEQRNYIIVLIFLFLVYASVWHFYRMVFTDRFVGTWFDYFWGMARGGWIILKDMPISSIIFYITPIGFIVWLLTFKSLNTPARSLLFFYMMVYTAFHFYIIRYTPYHYYYARYQLSEIIPLLFLFIAIFSMETLKKKRLFTYLILIPILVYSGIYSAFLFQGPVGTTSKMFQELSENVEKKDIVLFYNPLDWADNFIFSPLKHYFGFKAINVNQLTDVYTYGTDIKDYYVDDVFILSTVPIDNSKLFLVDKLRFEKGFYANVVEDNPPLRNEINDWQIPGCSMIIDERFCSGALPIKYHSASLDLYLYNYR